MADETVLCVSEPRMAIPASRNIAKPSTAASSLNPLEEAWSYWVDAWQRGILFLDVLQQRSERYGEHAAKTAPHVLKFGFELVMDGRKLKRPVNYALVRITPPEGVEIDERKRPFVIVDPRAGHGPGIGGFKPQSEIGVAFKAGHPCYFIGFLPEPVPGQTIEDIARAEAAFLERVIALHPEAEGKPAVIGNCQAGWAVMLRRGHEARAFRANHHCGLAARLLGGGPRGKPHALFRRPARRQLAYRAHG